MSDISETSVWLKFFTEAGIPPSDATGYAITFTDNRIKQNMLMDLNKEYLKDMGITALGDIIAILKHAKSFSETLLKEKAFPKKKTKSLSPSGSQVPENSSNSVSKKSSPATRMLEHYVRKEPPPAPPTTEAASSSVPLVSKLCAGSKRSLEDEDSLRSSKRSSVFDRLGSENVVSSTTSDNPKITVTILGKNKLKEKESSPTTVVETEPTTLKKTVHKGGLQYHGILKYSKKELEQRKQYLQEKLAKSPNLSVTVKADQSNTTPAVKSRLGRTVRSYHSEGIFARELDETVARKSPSVERTIKNKTVPTEGLVIKKVVKVNKKTGQIVSEQRKQGRSSVFNRLDN